MTSIKILLTGATGYIGGSVLSALLRHPRSDEFNITVLVRSEEKAPLFAAVRVTPVVGSHEDSTLLKNLASQADVVISCADADNLNAVKAVLSGLRHRHDNTGSLPILIHTSGIGALYVLRQLSLFQSTLVPGVLIDDAQGNRISNVIYSDFNIHLLESLPHTQPHRKVDMAITEASEEGYVKTCNILPGLVHGVAQTPLVSLGIQNPRSQQISAIINAGIDRRQGGIIGKGINVWSHVHIEDLACLYMHIFDAAINSCRLYVGRIGMYFAVNGECEVGDIFGVVAKELGARGCGAGHPTVFTQAEMEKYTFTRMLGANARAKGERARSIGWRPVYGIQSLLESIRDEVARLMDTKGASL